MRLAPVRGSVHARVPLESRLAILRPAPFYPELRGVHSMPSSVTAAAAAAADFVWFAMTSSLISVDPGLFRAGLCDLQHCPLCINSRIY